MRLDFTVSWVPEMYSSDSNTVAEKERSRREEIRSRLESVAVLWFMISCPFVYALVLIQTHTRLLIRIYGYHPRAARLYVCLVPKCKPRSLLGMYTSMRSTPAPSNYSANLQKRPSTAALLDVLRWSIRITVVVDRVSSTTLWRCRCMWLE